MIDIEKEREAFESDDCGNNAKVDPLQNKAAPEHIWMQTDPDDGKLRDYDTWCLDQINDTDTLYIRADMTPVAGQADSAAKDVRLDGLREDAARFAWLLDLMLGSDLEEFDSKSRRLAVALALGLSGREAIDVAMHSHPAKKEVQDD